MQLKGTDLLALQPPQVMGRVLTVVRAARLGRRDLVGLLCRVRFRPSSVCDTLRSIIDCEDTELLRGMEWGAVVTVDRSPMYMRFHAPADALAQVEPEFRLKYSLRLS